MNRLEVQEVYDKVRTPRTIAAIETLGLKSCLFDDLFGTCSVDNISDTDVYIKVKQKLESLCEYALNVKPEPAAKDCNGDPICIGGTVWFDDEEYLVRAYKPASALRALQDTLQKDVFSKLETALESLTEAQKD